MAFDSRFFTICMRRFASVTMCAAEARIEIRGEREMARLGLVAEIALDGLAQLRERQLLALHRDRARLDLRQVEDVADEIQQVGAGARGWSWRIPPGAPMRLLSGFSESCWPRIRMLLSGVRSSCDMLARNSVL